VITLRASDDIDLAVWAARFNGRFVVVVEEAARPVGFAELELNGHIGRVYVSADHQRRGVGQALMNEVLSEAKRLGLVRLFVAAGITALPFFAAQGFSVITSQVVACRGAEFVNYRMERTLS
jgi:GNAT superfamily N-acetyltransferase